jgi:hypothetical protein
LYPKIRNPIQTWLLAVFTGGLYIIYWVGRVSREINLAEEKNILPIDYWSKFFIGWLAAYFVSFVYLLTTENIFPFVIIATIWLWFSFKVIVVIGKYVRQKQIANGESKPVNPVGAYFLLFAWILGLPYLQINLNKVIRHEQQNS